MAIEVEPELKDVAAAVRERGFFGELKEGSARQESGTVIFWWELVVPEHTDKDSSDGDLMTRSQRLVLPTTDQNVLKLLAESGIKGVVQDVFEVKGEELELLWQQVVPEEL